MDGFVGLTVVVPKGMDFGDGRVDVMVVIGNCRQSGSFDSDHGRPSAAREQRCNDILSRRCGTISEYEYRNRKRMTRSRLPCLTP